MLFGLILLFLWIAIAFFHYLQGIFSATLSAILAIISAVVALSFSEQLASTMASTKIVEDAFSISLVVLFAGIYIILRLLFDSFVPGNVRVPVLVDKIGASIMGIIAALFGTGIVAIAGDALPFDAAPGGFSRFETHDVKGQTESIGGRQALDETSLNAMVSNDLSPTSSSKNHLIFWQDDLVVGAMNKLSNGALAGDVPFDNVHPNFLDELFGQRVGMQLGAKRTLFSPTSGMRVLGVYTTDTPIPQFNVDYAEMELRNDPLPAKLAPTDFASQTLLIVRTQISDKDAAADADGGFRFSSGAVRLVTGTPDSGFLDYHPVAELDPSGSALAMRADDFLLSSMPVTIDLIFIVDNDHLQLGTDGKSLLLGPGSYLQVKRYAIADLVNTKLVAGLPPPNPDKTPLVLPTNIAAYFAGKSPAAPIVAPPGGTPAAPSAGTSAAPPTQAIAPSAGPGASAGPAGSASSVPASASLGARTTLQGLSKILSTDVINGQVLVAPTDHDELGFWNIADGRQIGKVAVDQGPTFVASNPAGTIVVTGSPSNALTFCDTNQHTVIGKVMLGNTVTSAVFSADGKTVAAANGFGTIFFIDSTTHEKQRRISPGLHGNVRLIPSPDHSKFLAVGDGEDMFLCDFTAAAPIKLHGHSPQQGNVAIPAIAFSFFIASGGADGTVRFWAVSNGQAGDTIDLGSPLVCVAFRFDGLSTAAAAESGVQIVPSHGPKVPLQNSAGVRAVAFTPDSQTLITGDASRIELWNTQTNLPVSQVPVQGGVEKLFFTPDGKTLITLSTDGTARLWSYTP